MSARAHRLLATLLAALLVALHLDFWRTQRPNLWLGWLPEELLWRLAWMAAAFAYLVYFTRCVWTEEDEA